MTMQDPTETESALMAAVKAAESLDALEEVRVRALGRKGQITDMMKALGSMAPEERRNAGPLLNGLKARVSAAIDARRADLEAAHLEVRLREESVDLSLPVRPEHVGTVHPVSQVTEELIAIFADMGFELAEGPDVEDDFHNFTALNMPPEHPARQMHDTFYLAPDDSGAQKLLRTHTSTVQIRSMMSRPPPHRIIVPGRTYRSDSDMTHPDVSSGGGSGDRQNDSHGSSEGLFDRVCPGVLRR